MIKILRNIDSKKIAEYVIGLPTTQNVAVLARNHSLLIKLSEELDSIKFPHVYIGKESALIHSEEFMRFHAFLKLICNPYDNLAFLLIKDIIGLSAAQYSLIRMTASELHMSHFKMWINNVEPRDAYQAFYQDADPNDLNITLQLLDNLINDFADINVNPIREYFIKYLDIAHNPTVQDYLDWLATVDIQDEIKEDYEGLTLMTIHAAKGLEWDTVIVAGCNEEILPSKQALNNDDIEAERRLMYVAMTRAKDNLVLTVRPETKEVNGRVYNNPESRFIKEIY